MSFWLTKKIIMGGTTAVGIDPSNKYLLVVSHSGRGLFKLSDGKRIARDTQVLGPWYYGAQSEGLGPLAGVMIPIYGSGAKTPLAILQYLDRNKIEYEADDLHGVALTTDHRFVVLGYPDMVEIYQSE